ncbi:hypothetical protein CesoFtcFv8_012557 [Champsocephalus esox]|uniref:Uncharacterized protein n=1 Tax=Champsocephalus esox TaxID=159716 RepID=A0AAN8BVE5_9TELE|nr:hypothetical protein CesoFtcFv8_012557 [Champsocephalus esox]
MAGETQSALGMLSETPGLLLRGGQFDETGMSPPALTYFPHLPHLSRPTRPSPTLPHDHHPPTPGTAVPGGCRVTDGIHQPPPLALPSPPYCTSPPARPPRWRSGGPDQCHSVSLEPG